MSGSIILAIVAIVSALLIYKTIKAEETKRTAKETRKALFRLFMGGVIGLIVLVSFFWLFLIIAGRTPDKLSPYISELPYITSSVVALIGFCIGAILGLIKRKANDKTA